MINITRSYPAPKSLKTVKIQQYLDKFKDYQTDQLLPLHEQTILKPECNEPYRNIDVLEEFDTCFYAKCYLTEQNFIALRKWILIILFLKMNAQL